ncbi:protein phosphatase 2C domain-containing protein [Ilyomonas limi]|uniref:Protein phosphatase 2C domain-containing protein n=1 Tax=Ilyomonas limi TaxID=2575867 RepID=A0A4U3L2B5_9BACT|nr:PP2C family serine/threonine-protein phosphatase [Ilyomonas limi]TKK69291.1 protein phosphatase 2C domain-containing protein [Ilyomonas limi]
MEDAKQFVTNLFKSNNMPIPASRMDVLDAFIQDEQNIAAINTIIQNQNGLMAKWKLEDRIAEIRQQPVRVLNATVGKPYETKFDFDKLQWKDITTFEWEGLQEVGLRYDEQTKQITGVPTQSGDIKAKFKFKIEGQPEVAPFNEKIITLIINPDPKSLWKNIESDRNDPFWKEDNITEFAPLGDRHILVSSKRGRSHANIGSCREDDFAFKDLDNGWSIVVVADGAGSAKLSRKGSAMACNEVVGYFDESTSIESMAAFDELLHEHMGNASADTKKNLTHFVYNTLGKCALQVHKKLQEFATKEGITLKDLSSTLIFTLFKKYDAGYALLSFGVGDCPIAVLNKDISEVILMNWLDVGEFGGGTRFITMPEIFKSDKFATRFGFKLLDDFAYLIMMTDGIYDPKFVVEASLPDIKKWKAFLADLNGKNEDGVSVELQPDNENITDQFSRWMDFWSAGNHDDRTLAIVF